MSGHRRITLTVRPDGTIHATTQNVRGSDCMSLLDPIQQLCPGAVVAHSQLTADFHITNTSVEESVTDEVEEGS